MSGTAPATMRAGIEAGLLTALLLLDSTWEVSRYAYVPVESQLFAQTLADTAQVEELSFAVGLGASNSTAHRQSVAEGQRIVQTDVVVRMTRRLQGDDHVAAYDVALGHEAQLVKSIAGLTVVPLRIVTINRSIVGDGTVYLAEVSCVALHGYPLV